MKHMNLIWHGNSNKPSMVERSGCAQDDVGNRDGSKETSTLDNSGLRWAAAAR